MLNYYQLISCLISFFKTYSLWDGDQHVDHSHKDCHCWFPHASGDRICVFFFRCWKSIGVILGASPHCSYTYMYIYIDILYIYACNICIYVYKIISYCFSGHMNHSSKQIKTLGSTFYAVDSISDRRTSTIYNFWNCSC